MIKLRAATLLCLLACGLLAATALAAPRVMLVESFTNDSCPGCPEANAVTNAFLAAYGPALTLGVQYHMFWPDPSDPFYLATKEDADGRRAYYSINSIPSVFCDGTETAAGSLSALEAVAGTRLGTDSPFTIAVEQAIDGGTITVTATVSAVGDLPPGALALRVALIETEIHLEDPIGDNKEADFYNTLRDMLPNQLGTPLAIAPGESQVFVLSAPVDAAWNLANIRAVVWVQNDATKEVLQAGSQAPRPDLAFFFGSSKRVDLVDLGTPVRFTCLLSNYGNLSDTYDVHVAPELPAGWSGTLSTGDASYPLAPLDLVLSLGTLEQAALVLDIQALVTAGTGAATLSATSRADPARTLTCRIRAISSGVPILFVDNDDGDTRETYYTAALDASGHVYGAWDYALDGPPTAALLARFPIVVWSAKFGLPPISLEDMDLLGDFLDNGGRLFISDPLIGYFYAGGFPIFTPETQAWYNDYLGADYIGTLINNTRVTGLDGDPIGDGLSFKLGGGTSSDFVVYPYSVEPRPGAVGCLLFNSATAGIRYDAGAFRVVYLAYGFENQDSEESRNLVMSRSLDWLGVQLVGVPDARPPLLAGAPTAAPNPFNPATRIAFTVGGAEPVPARVAIHDLRGRLVRTLWDGPAAPGERALTWDGRTDAGAEAASGVYLARVRVADSERSLKLTLAK